MAKFFLYSSIPLTTISNSANLTCVCLCSSGDHTEDRRHPQGKMCGMFRPPSQPRPIGRSPLAPPGHGRVSREGEIRAEQITGRVEVNHVHTFHGLHDIHATCLGKVYGGSFVLEMVYLNRV